MSDATKVVDASQVTVHILAGRRSACGRPAGEPPSWPEGHVWVRLDRAYLVSCPKCQGLIPELRGDAEPRPIGDMIDLVLSQSRSQNGVS